MMTEIGEETEGGKRRIIVVVAVAVSEIERVKSAYRMSPREETRDRDCPLAGNNQLQRLARVKQACVMRSKKVNVREVIAAGTITFEMNGEAVVVIEIEIITGSPGGRGKCSKGSRWEVSCGRALLSISRDITEEEEVCGEEEMTCLLLWG